ncbi:MAG: hypothetical protein LBS48_00505 [Treponema sp.]|jgi:hypothetical protein|nr:hypothetical protein [Treponema sp.]
MKKRLVPLLTAFFFPFLVHSQEAKPVIRFSPFYTKGIGIEEIRFVESLVQSYLSDFGDVVNYFDNSLPPAGSENSSLPASWTRAPDYVASGSIYMEPDGRIFTLEIHNTLTGETVSSTTVHRTASDLALKARSLVESIFNLPVQTARVRDGTDTGGPGANPEPITEKDITGTWRGESGVEMIRLQQGGRGIAFFSSGAQMNLTYTIENNMLKVRQNSPNTERYYYPLPYGVARQLTAEAGPMTWELYLYSGGAHLRGVKISTEAKVEGNLLVDLLPGSSRETEWTRAPR